MGRVRHCCSVVSKGTFWVEIEHLKYLSEISKFETFLQHFENSLQTLDGLNRHGERDDHPWEGDGSNHEDHVADIRHHVLKGTKTVFE